jgi:hypothetical protein
MKALKENRYSNLEVSKDFNIIILNKIQGYDGKKKEQLKSFLEDIQQGGCISGMIGDFIYNSDCKDFYINHIDELEEMKQDFEDEIGGQIENKNKLPHYTFVVWLCFEEYCNNLYVENYENN